MIKFTIPSTFVKQIFIPSFILLIGLAVLCSFFPIQIESNLANIQEYIFNNLSWVYILTVSTILILLLMIAFSKAGNLRLGPDNSRPQYGYISWFAMLFSAGMGIGIMYFGVAEPLSHFASPAIEGTVQKDKMAQLYTFFHWGLHAWAVYALIGLSLAYFSYRYKLPLSIRSSLYPILKSKVNGPVGYLIDIFALCSTFFGLTTSLGFGAVQIASGLTYLHLIPENSFFYQSIIIFFIIVGAIVSAVSGLGKGLKIASEANILLALALMLLVLFFGPSVYLLNAFSEGLGTYLNNFFALAFNTFAFEEGSKPWFQNWTVLYWAWWISWSPFVGLFIAKISRERTIREFILSVLLMPSLFIFLWMTVFGSGAIWMDQHVLHGSLSKLVNQPDTLLFHFLSHYPASSLLLCIAVLVIGLFFLTSADSGLLVMDGISSRNSPRSPKWQSVYWGIMLIILPLALLKSGGLKALQTMTLISALPYSVVMLIVCYCLVRTLRQDLASYSATSPSVSRNFDPSHWKSRLEQILTFNQKEDIGKFMKDTVRPAFEMLLEELNEKGIKAEIISKEKPRLSIELLIHHDKVRNFRYGVVAEEKKVSDHLVEDDKMPTVTSSISYSPVTYYNDGRRGNDIQYLSKMEIIADFLHEYERYILLLAEGKNEMLIES